MKAMAKLNFKSWLRQLPKALSPRHETLETGNSAETVTKHNGTATASPTVAATSMSQLAGKITAETRKLEAYMHQNGLQMPSHDVNSPDFPQLSEEINKSRFEIIDATKKLREMTIGPRECVRWAVWDVRCPSQILVWRVT
jgi:hypothetical protein